MGEERAHANTFDAMMYLFLLKTEQTHTVSRVNGQCQDKQDQQWINFTAGKINASYSPDRTLHSVRSDARDDDAVFLTTLKRVHGIHLRQPVHKERRHWRKTRIKHTFLQQ